MTSSTYAWEFGLYRHQNASRIHSFYIFIRMYIFHTQTEYKKSLVFCRLQGKYIPVYILILQSIIHIFQLNKTDVTRKNCMTSVSCYIAQLLLQYIITLYAVFIALLASMFQKREFTILFDGKISCFYCISFSVNTQKYRPWVYYQHILKISPVSASMFLEIKILVKQKCKLFVEQQDIQAGSLFSSALYQFQLCGQT